MKEGFEPRLVGFLCNWCSYAGADLAGTSRIQYPHNIRVIRVMCSGAVDTVYINRALLEGADGVLVAGCHLGDCHYQNGNYKARRRMALLKNIKTPQVERICDRIRALRNYPENKMRPF